ncbi:MAG: DUF5723 family protein [Bacteroidota bacterium]|nr:DUF5723 family protein [Bacteroidota bacterium]
MKKITIFILLSISSNYFSQNYLGISSSNYAGSMGTDIQPASFVDGRFKFDLNLFSLNFSAYQNFAHFDTRGMDKWWVKSFSPDETVTINPDGSETTSYSTEIGGSNPYNDWIIPESDFDSLYITRRYDQNSPGVLGFNTNFQFDLLNFNFHVTPKISVGFLAKMRSITNIDNVDPKLAFLAERELEYEDLWGIRLNEELINFNHMTWSEFGLNYGQVLTDAGQHFLKAGANVKYLSGYAAAYMYSNNFEYDLFNDDTTQYLAGDFGYGYSQNIADAANNTLDQSGIFGLPKASAKGIGVDLGVVYEWRPDFKDYKYDMDGEMNLWARDQNKYKLRVGLSITDIGGMSFQKAGISRDFSVNTSNLFDLTIFDEVQSLEGFDTTINGLINQSTALGNSEWTAGERDTLSTFYMRTPTAFSFQIDYHIWKWFYVNSTGIFNIISKNKDSKVKVANQFSITPSFDHAWFGIHLPFSVNDYSGFKAGLGARLGPLTVGVTDYRFLFATGNVRGAEFYAGVRVPILYDAPNDLDGDKVSDKVDDCIDVPGPWTFKGCPDTDNDGIIDMKDDCPLDSGLVAFNGCPDRDNDSIPDRVDDCPDTPGLAKFNGCPDTDLDGIMDKEDDCPLDSGLVAFKGCPDTDLDGIMDKEDDCPLDSGLVEFNGCPDTDGDGISDQEDACPLVYGKKEFQGCPDTDGDGIIDGIDDCIETPGPKENNGCPWPDTDEDGLLDKDDDCPTIPGPKENNGCPYLDTDEDGLLDKDDECPNTPGPIENNGCPVIEEEVVEVLQTAFDNLEFRTAKDIILNESKPSLEELSNVLIERPTWKLEISGHTDNVGNEDKNMVLSKKRAESVKRFLVDHGVDETHLIIKFFGETAPIADNNTAEGRQKNRRVEMKIIFE